MIGEEGGIAAICSGACNSGAELKATFAGVASTLSLALVEVIVTELKRFENLRGADDDGTSEALDGTQSSSVKLNRALSRCA
jgi:hypothetical protein